MKFHDSQIATVSHFRLVSYLRLIGWGPTVTLITVTYITATTTYCNALLFPDTVQKMFNIASFLGGILNICINDDILFEGMVSMLTFSMFCVIGDGPGYLPKQWKKGNTSRVIFLDAIASLGVGVSVTE